MLGFICADRWMKNRYGGPLRASSWRSEFHLKVYVDMVDTPAFHSDVIAYPAITIIARDKPGVDTHRAPPGHRAAGFERTGNAASRKTTADRKPEPCVNLPVSPAGPSHGFSNRPINWRWCAASNRGFPTLEEAGCKVGIGVATGADQAFIGLFDALDVEDDRKRRW